MIYSEKQLAVSKSELSKLKAALAEVENRSTGEAWLRKAEAEALQSQVADIEAEISTYELLRSGQVSLSKTSSLEELPTVLVQARIASGMSQTQLAEKLGMKPQQIQRYEASEYMGASLARLVEVARTLGVKATGTFEGARNVSNSVFVWSNTDDVVWGQFPYKEMIKRKWFSAPRGSDPVPLVKDYFLRAAGPQFATAVHRKKMRSGTVPNEYSLLAWQSRILEKARERIESDEVADYAFDDKWIPSLVDLTRREDGPQRAVNLLSEKGIVLIIERHLPGSYLDGAAMIGDSGRPIVGLTLRHDRLDNFWFVLLHELGHIFLHLNDGMRFDFFDEENSVGDAIEQEADQFALNALIPDALWNDCLSRFALSEESVRIDAERLGIHASIIAGRIRKEQDNYTILGGLVGQGLVRAQLEKVDNEVD